MPVITLEVLHPNSGNEPVSDVETSRHPNNANETTMETDEGPSETDEESTKVEEKEEEREEIKIRNDLLEYMMRDDGSVICKLCGEVLHSRPHWYRHKYKVHVVQPSTFTPSPLFQCEQCLSFFKSRKGYIGHLASRHSELLEDSHPVLTNTQAEAASKEKLALPPVPDLHIRSLTVCDAKTNTDPELSIPMSTVPNYNSLSNKSKGIDAKKIPKTTKIDTAKVKMDLEEKRNKEEKLVAEIIDRVRRECEAQQGTGGPTRRGYSRRTTVMHNNDAGAGASEFSSQPKTSTTAATKVV